MAYCSFYTWRKEDQRALLSRTGCGKPEDPCMELPASCLRSDQEFPREKEMEQLLREQLTNSRKYILLYTWVYSDASQRQPQADCSEHSNACQALSSLSPFCFNLRILDHMDIGPLTRKLFPNQNWKASKYLEDPGGGSHTLWKKVIQARGQKGEAPMYGNGTCSLLGWLQYD